ncbi:MAG: ATP-binding protein [Paludibacteraceae bacterium]|nr:ATP-binding protein [Paludibacteraceae bacterium]
MEAKDYLHRIADNELSLRLEAFGAVQIKGPKWCGKTTTAERQCKSKIKLQDPDKRDAYLTTAKTKPSILLKGETPRLIDEWQDAPILWDAVRNSVDERQLKGQFILTGSTVMKSDSTLSEAQQRMHTGTGRIATMTMYPMSLYESKDSKGEISFLELFDNPSLDIDGITSELSIEDLIMLACRGGWPDSLKVKNEKAKLLIAKDYVNKVCDDDISRIDNIKRNPELTRLILRSYARNLCTLAKKSAILNDVNAEMSVISQVTFDDYVDALKRLYVLEDIDAWCPAIRSASAIRVGKKRCFIDPSIAIAAMGASPKILELDLKTFGFIFECMCIRDLRVYSQSMGGRVSYYHDRYGLEADIVLHLDDNRYALIECKLGSRDIEEGAQHLLELRDLIREKNMTEKQMPLREPDLLIVITCGEFAYTREDGVKVIPLGCLKD